MDQKQCRNCGNYYFTSGYRMVYVTRNKIPDPKAARGDREGVYLPCCPMCLDLENDLEDL